MESVIEQLCHGNIAPLDCPPPDDEDARAAHAKYRQLYEQFAQKLDDAARRELNSLIDAHAEETYYEVADCFVRGFRLGARMMLDILQGNI